MNVGDRVIYRCTDNAYRLSPEREGKTGTITEIASENNIEVQFDVPIGKDKYTDPLGCFPQNLHLLGEKGMATNITITLPNGLVVTGTPTQVQDLATKLGYVIGPMYNSDTHGLIPIASMDTNHIKNALLKSYRNWVMRLSGITNTRTLIEALRDGPSDKEFSDLLTEFVKRVK